MTLGPFLFGAPLALLGLIALPVIWWVLRATPPTPKEAELPSMRLLDGVDPREETPVRTPWWILLIRTLAAALALAGLAQPIYAPGANRTEPADGALLIVIDDGWRSAARWNELTEAATAALDSVGRDAPVHLLLTTPKSLPIDPTLRLSRTDASRRIASLSPVAWAPDRDDALTRLEKSGIRPARILWASDGLGAEGGTAFATALAGYGALSVYAAPPRGPMAITGLAVDAESASATLRRASGAGKNSVFVSALTLEGAALATSEATFAPGETEAVADFELPAAALSRISRFALTVRPTAGSVWLWDSTDRVRRVGLVSGGDTAQPLLSDVHYVRKALEPFARLTEGELSDLVENGPDAIIVTDIGRLSASERTALTAWIEEGGALIRFAGPRLAAQGDTLVPTPLRRSSRALGGALAWDEPQAIGSFPETSPFAGLTPPADARVRQQVLAQPAPDLQTKTWARLADGSPLVTAERRGAGSVILFHVTAGPAWSDLPYHGLFVDMLRRSIAAGRGEAASDEDGAYVPRLVLDAYGRLVPPADTAAPLQAGDFVNTLPSETNPPGLYRGPSGTRAINAGRDLRPTPITDWPASATLLGDAEATSLRLGGPFLTAAALLLALDLFIALIVAGRIRFSRKSASAAAFLIGAALFIPSLSEAQGSGELTKDVEAALDFRLAYVETGDKRLDRATRAGLEGLARVLFLRSSVEPAETHSLDLETDALDLYPLIYYAVPDTAEALSETAIDRLNAYLRGGGALIIDTRKGGEIGSDSNVTSLEGLLSGLDAPPVAPVPNDHVLTKSFYLIDGFPGRYDNRRLWIEAPPSAGQPARGDGVSRLFIGDADWASAWAVDDRGRPLYSVDGGQTQREMANRFGVNLVMYVLTGSYKEDQVHLPALLERLSDDEIEEDFDLDDLPGSIMDGGPQ
ncbi:MAG: DUF4159 domain-containing protein [Pseudomonadota bacterium]